MTSAPLPASVADRAAAPFDVPSDAAAARAWTAHATGLLAREAARSADTHLLHLTLPGFPGIDFYFKDESSHPSGSLKHRLARSLYLYALCNGRLSKGQRVVDASSGSTAISEAWFARLLGLEFTAVMPACTAPDKIALVRQFGGRCQLVDPPSQVQARAHQLAEEGACHLDQFGLAERATDWRGNNNIAESLLTQMAGEPRPVPDWIVCGAGTGGTSATIGRYLRYRGLPTRLCVAEPTGGAFAVAWATRDAKARATRASVIEGIGRPCAEAGFIPEVVDRVIEVDDVQSIAAMRVLHALLGTRCGGSTGTNFIACLRLAAEQVAQRRRASIVTLLCDGGERYARTLGCEDWLCARGLAVSVAAHAALLQRRVAG